jgi:hypothetical protein
MPITPAGFAAEDLQRLKIPPPPFDAPQLDRSKPAAERIEQYDHRQPHCINSGQAKPIAVRRSLAWTDMWIPLEKV